MVRLILNGFKTFGLHEMSLIYLYIINVKFFKNFDFFDFFVKFKIQLIFEQIRLDEIRHSNRLWT